ncbi:MAG: 3-deoxy-manno-octulosonate cytidylyltransferase [Pseudomonadota bacterium]
MQQTYNIVIPARYASSRLPGKPLLEIAGKTMLQHTYERACLSCAEKVIIATDDERILASARLYTDDVLLTSEHHQSGTDRLAEVVEQQGWDDETIIVNVQGDEPLILSEHIEQVADLLVTHADAGISTLSYRIQSTSELFDPNVVKVVCDVNGYALYFSRAVIPWHRDEFVESRIPQKTLLQNTPYYRHIGMYAYRANTLKVYQSLKPIPLEQAESLEQLRALYYGIKIIVSETDKQPGHGVDIHADLKLVEQLMQRHGLKQE